MLRKKPRLDHNHHEIVKALRQCGCSVLSLAGVSNGCPDILVARAEQMWIAEIKDGDKSPSQRRLTEDEQSWHRQWRAPVFILNSVDDALRMIGAK